MSQQTINKIIDSEYTPLAVFLLVGLVTTSPLIAIAVTIILALLLSIYDYFARPDTDPYLWRLLVKASHSWNTPVIIGFGFVSAFTGNPELALAIALALILLGYGYSRFGSRKAQQPNHQ